MKFRFHIILFLLLIYTCDRQLIAPVRDNPFDSASGLTNPFNLQTKNFSDHILVSWGYTYEKPVIDSYLLYRINGSDVDTLYEGIEKTTFEDNTVVWDSTYSYYVTGIINEKETSPPDIGDIPEVVRRIYVGEDGDYTRIGDAINSLNDGDVIYVKDGTYQENIDWNGKKISLICDGESSCIIDGNGETVVTFRGDLDSTAVLDGFTITGGNNNDVIDGGGMTIRTGSDPLIQNCTFTNNSADRGAAVFVRERAKPSFIGCNFTINTSTEDGGAIFCERDSKPKIENCTFTGNQSTEGNGGAIASEEASPIITSCTFTSNHASEGSGGAISINESQEDTVRLSTFTFNTAKEGGAVYTFHVKNSQFIQCKFEGNSGDYGGGIYLEGSGKEVTPILFTNCIFLHNEADYGGGAILGTKSDNLYSYLKLDHCTLTGNKTKEGGVSEGGGAHISIGSKLTVLNSLLLNNTADEYPEIYSLISGSVTVSYSNVQGGWAGEGNIDADPLFENSTNGDLHLKADSPCKGAGEGGSDMGAYGGIYGDWGE